MGKVKEFAMWLVESIYVHHWTDEQILDSIANQYPDGQRPGVQNWLREQIKTVKENPTLYESMLDKQGEENV